ncbi:MAG: nitroreductase family protein [Dehalococcoidales bacterium]|nr:nitroreductase family protein [Dehalococcoidales bacterium]
MKRQAVINDVGMAAENMMLVAQEQEIGTCPILSFF